MGVTAVVEECATVSHLRHLSWFRSLSARRGSEDRLQVTSRVCACVQAQCVLSVSQLCYI